MAGDRISIGVFVGLVKKYKNNYKIIGTYRNVYQQTKNVFDYKTRTYDKVISYVIDSRSVYDVEEYMAIAIGKIPRGSDKIVVKLENFYTGRIEQDIYQFDNLVLIPNPEFNVDQSGVAKCVALKEDLKDGIFKGISFDETSDKASEDIAEDEED